MIVQGGNIYIYENLIQYLSKGTYIYESAVISMQLSCVSIVYLKINKGQRHVAFTSTNPIGIGCIVSNLINFEYIMVTLSNFPRDL